MSQLPEEIGKPNFGLSSYGHDNGREYKEYLLTELGTLALLGRYSKPLRRQVEREWLEHKKEAATPSFQIEDPIARAEKWIVEHKQLKLSEQQLELSEQQRVESESRITRLQHNLETKVKPAFRQLTERAEVAENELAKIIAKPKKEDEVQPYEVARALHVISSSGKPHSSMVGDILNRSNIIPRSVYDSNIGQWVNVYSAQDAMEIVRTYLLDYETCKGHISKGLRCNFKFEIIHRVRWAA